ncbi:MAG: DUF2812 domain-containing protein [Eubacteriales bacterium]|nr:DUF2812 domain-containing protein [Eubacteriales bacterium]MDD4475890.1 DUF2812 domain-containing protein [Eubacteriales bacterium]
MKRTKHSFFIFRRGDKRLSNIITAQAKLGNIFVSISPLGIITFKNGEPSDHIYRVEDPDLPKDLQLYDKDIFEEVFRSKSYVVFRSTKPIGEDALIENASFEAWEYELETTWLADKASKGLFLRRKKGDTFYFVKGDPGDYTYRIDYQIIKNPKEYLERMKSDGWDYVCSSKNDHYFIRPGVYHEKVSVKPEVKALKKKIRFRWFVFVMLLALLVVGAAFIVGGVFTENAFLARKILFFGLGAFFVVSAISIYISVIKGYIYLHKKKKLLKIRGE